MVDSKRDAAVALAKQGRRIFPLVPNGKTPALAGVDWRKTATTDPARVFDMWTCPVMEAELDFNIGIALDADTVIVDVDVGDGKQGDKSLALLEAIYEPLPLTRIVRTASGGRHREYKALQPIGNSASKIGKHIDIKSEGGFVVAPGSVIDGVPYVLECDAPVAPVPAFVHTLAGEIKERPTTSTMSMTDDLDTDSAKARAIDYLTTKAPESGTYAVAAKVKDFGISQELCGELLEEHWPGAEGKSTEHIEFRVANAYRYGTSAPGINAPEAEFEAVQINETPPPKRKGLYFAEWKETEIEMDRPYLIDGILESGSMIVTYGDSNTGKTFVALDQGYHIAAGKPWNGHDVKQGGVVYVASEGGTGFYKRLEALKRHFGRRDNIPFFTVPCLVDLFSDRGNTAELAKVIKETEQRSGQKTALVVIDTLARAMAGGDENTSTDMGKFVANCDRIRAATGAALNIVHHTGKDAAKGARGSSALRAATDTEIEIGGGVLTMMKQRDAGKFESLRFDLEVVEVGRRPDGKSITSCVVRWVKSSEFEARVTPAAMEMLALFDQLLSAKRDELADQNEDPDTATVAWPEWQLLGLSVFKGPKGGAVSAAYLYKLRKELVTSDLIRETKQKQWVKGNCNLSNPGVT